MPEKILMVDDEAAVLQGYQRLLRTEFNIDTAVGGAGGLIALAKNGPYAVVVSDMRMPGMDGIQFLTQVKAEAPDTIRIMLTGNTDIATAMHAVNEGNIFRFLTKPCSKEVLARTLTAGLMQYRLITAEGELLEKTLRGSIHVLTEVLSLVNPTAFSRAARVQRYVSHVAKKLALRNPWRFEVAAMMSQLGCVTIHPDIVEAVYAEKTLSAKDQAMFDAHPSIARDLLASIPRMEPIAWIIAHQNQLPPVEGDIASLEMAEMRVGAQILRVALVFDELIRKGASKTEAAHQLARRFQGIDGRIFEALVELEPETAEMERRTCSLEDLSVGMILNEDVRTAAGSLIVAKGQEITLPLILKLKNFHEKGAFTGTVTVSLRKQKVFTATSKA
jgi:response regulator RpfG family c-di-GMP phosphodiesterase